MNNPKIRAAQKAAAEYLLPHVVILGGGFGGIAAAKALANAPVRVTILDRNNHHTFQPLLYQAATASLSPSQVAYPIRTVFQKQENVEVLLAEVTSIDLGKRVVSSPDLDVSYDYLILAVGTATDYRGKPEWERFAPGLKDLDDALEIRRRILVAFEQAESAINRQMQKELLTFVIIGGGSTGVELAGAVGQLVPVLLKDFRHLNADDVKIIILHGGDRILSNYPDHLSERAEKDLAELGVTVLKNVWVETLNTQGATLADGTQIRSQTMIWAAGVRGNPLLKKLGLPTNRYNRFGQLKVQADLSVPGYPEVFAVGDAAEFLQDGQPIATLAPAAMQAGSAAARAILSDLGNVGRQEFRYHHRGDMTTIGRASAVAKIGTLELNGRFAWAAWLLVHLTFLCGFRNRLFVLLEWLWAYGTSQRSARLITAHRLRAGAPDNQIGSPS